MPRVLLLATTTGYQTRAFGEAAERLGVDLVYATDRCNVLADPWQDAALAIRFPAPDAPPGDGAPRVGVTPALLPIALIAFAYVGIEAGLTVFALPYAGHLGLEAARGQQGISAFWLGLFSGRLGVLALHRSLDADLLTAAGLAGTLVLGAAALAPTAQIEVTSSPPVSRWAASTR